MHYFLAWMLFSNQYPYFMTEMITSRPVFARRKRRRENTSKSFFRGPKPIHPVPLFTRILRSLDVRCYLQVPGSFLKKTIRESSYSSSPIENELHLVLVRKCFVWMNWTAKNSTTVVYTNPNGKKMCSHCAHNSEHFFTSIVHPVSMISSLKFV